MAKVLRLPTPDEPAEPGLFAGDELVNNLIPGGETLEHLVMVSDDVWDLAGHLSWKGKQGAMTRFPFDRLAPRWRPAAKELVLLQLNPTLAGERAPNVPLGQTWVQVQEPVVPVTAQGNLKMLTQALALVDAHRITEFDEDERLAALMVQPADVESKRSGDALAATTGRGRSQQLVALWEVCHIAGRSLMGSRRPFDGRDVSGLFESRSRRNQTRPHDDVGHVLGFVAWFFDHVAEDIVTHLEWWANHTTPDPPMTRDETFAAMLDLAASLAHDSGGVLPGSTNLNGTVTIAAAPLARLLGVYDADEAYLAGRWAKTQLGDTVSYSLTASPCPLALTFVPDRNGDTGPWTDRLLPAKDSLDIWQRRLVYYAMYYLSATVMLRDAQLAVLPFDTLTTSTVERPDGTSYVRHELSAFRTKNRHTPTPTSVVVNGRIARIIGLLHRLHAALGYTPARSPQTGLPVLFDYRLATPLGKRPRVDAREGTYLDQSFIELIKGGARELHDRGILKRHLNDVKLSMAQVRITCAQAYAVREHGQALAAAFGQWDTRRVMAGYVGEIHRLITPIDPDDAADIIREDAGRRLAQAAADESLTGSGVPRLRETVSRNARALSNPAPLKAARLRTLGKNNPNIEQGPFSLCIFQPEGAMCGGKGKADFRLCWPGQCRNSVMSLADRARYEQMRRQYLNNGSDVSRRAADKMLDGNPAILEEFADTSDAELATIIVAHIDSYIAAALEDRA